MAETRERITTTTNELFRRSGYHATSLKDIGTGSGATTGSIYHFFPDGKIELAEAVLVESGAAYQELFESIYDGADSATHAVQAFFDGAADVLELTDFIDICPIGTVAREVASTEDRLRRAAAQVFENWDTSLGQRLVEAGLEPSAARELAITIIATLEGSFVLARTRRDAAVLRVTGRRCAAMVAAELDVGSPSRPR